MLITEILRVALPRARECGDGIITLAQLFAQITKREPR